MLAVVTGASGHLGASLVRTLVAREWKVKALVHNHARALEGVDVERVSGNILDEESLRQAFKGADIVFHLAACISVVGWNRKQVEAVNIAGVQNVVDACASEGVKRLVHTSSFHANKQKPLDEPLDETRPLVDLSKSPPYNRSKAEGERIVQQAISRGLDAIIVTPTGTIGPYDFQPSHFGAIILAMAQGKRRLIVDAGLDWVDTRDVAEGTIHAAEKAKSGEKYILSGYWASLKDIAQQVSRFCGHNSPSVVLPLWMGKTGAPFAAALDRMTGKRPLFTPISIKELESSRNVSHAKASRDLGYEPRPLEDTIADTLQWFQDNGFCIPR